MIAKKGIHGYHGNTGVARAQRRDESPCRTLASLPARFRSVAIFALLSLVMVLVLGGCDGENGRAASASPPTSSAGTDDVSVRTSQQSLDAAKVEVWADGLFRLLLDEYRISGGAIAVTHGSDVILTKGYGYADMATNAPVDADTSQFRIGSLTKTFFAVAVAQLLERGQIESLDDPVNKYLTRFQVPAYAGREITIWDMLTHQGGLDVAAVYVPDGGDRPEPLLTGEFIQANMPDVVREPGTISIYCNACSAVLGFMVEDIADLTLEAYLRDHVYDPLGMPNSTVTNAAQAAQSMVTQYAFRPGSVPIALPYPAISPYISYAGDMNSTATDMAQWLIANIERGAGPGPALMTPERYQTLHARKRGNHPATSGFGMQFFNYDYNGEQVLEHYGSIQFRSLQLMMLDSRIGVFMTVAGGGPSDVMPRSTDDLTEIPADAVVGEAVSHSGMREQILEYFLGPLEASEPVACDDNLEVYAGVYDYIPASSQVETARGTGRRVEVSTTGLMIDGLGDYVCSGPDTFTLDRPLPLEAGFRESNRYVFAAGPDGGMRMFAHINAGGFARRGNDKR